MNRVHVVTLGVSDMDRALRFYRDGLGFETSIEEENPPSVFFRSDGATLALCPRGGMAKDIGHKNPPQGAGFGGITLAYEKQCQMGILILRLNDAGQIAERWSAYGMVQ